VRWGKTKTAIDAASILFLKGEVSRVLVTTTTSGIGVWEAEIPKHSAVPWEIRLNESGPFGDVHAGVGVDEYADRGPLIWHVVNYENTFERLYEIPEPCPKHDRFTKGCTDCEEARRAARSWMPAIRKDLKKYAANFLISDEIHKLGRPGTLQSKMVFNYAKSAKRLVLTGSGFHRKILMVFGQFKIMNPSIFGTAYRQFENAHAIKGGYLNKEIKRYKGLGKIKKAVRENVYYAKDVPGGPVRQEIVPVRLEESAAAYEKMAAESIIALGEDRITAPVVLTRHLRLMQIAGGWVKTERGVYKRIGREKARAFEDWLTLMLEQDVNKIVIGCRFIPELADIAKIAERVGYKRLLLHGGVPRGRERERRIAAFSDTDQPVVFISQVSAGKEAIDLSAASTLAYYSMPESYLDFYQFNGRIKKYKETRTLAYYFFLARHTQDQVNYLAMKLKKDVADLILERPDIVERITAQE
jgi:hypothetical protein